MPLLDFESMSSAHRSSIHNERKAATFLASRSTLGFERIEAQIPSAHGRFELPPTYIPNDQLAVILASMVLYGDQGWKQRWIAFLLLVAARGGVIHYTKQGQESFMVEVEFPPNP